MQDSETALGYILDTDSKKSNCSNDEPVEVKVYQYNILAQSLTGIFEVESPSHVKKENREELLKNSFLKMIAENAIICLQIGRAHV